MRDGRASKKEGLRKKYGVPGSGTCVGGVRIPQQSLTSLHAPIEVEVLKMNHPGHFGNCEGDATRSALTDPKQAKRRVLWVDNPAAFDHTVLTQFAFDVALLRYWSAKSGSCSTRKIARSHGTARRAGP